MFRILNSILEEFKRLIDLKKQILDLQMAKMLMKILPFIHSLRTTKFQPGVFNVIDKDLKLINIKHSLKNEAAGYVIMHIMLESQHNKNLYAPLLHELYLYADVL